MYEISYLILIYCSNNDDNNNNDDVNVDVYHPTESPYLTVEILVEELMPL
jgi:hypothetical protein